MNRCRYIWRTISIISGIIRILVFIVVNVENYIKYQKRDKFFIKAYKSDENKIIGYNIIKQDFNVSNCENNSLFNIDVENIFKYIVCVQCDWENYFFLAILWITLGVNCFMLVLEVCMDCGWQTCLNNENESICHQKFFKFALKPMSIVATQASLLIPTHFIRLFDFDRSCLSYRSFWSLTYVQYPGIGLILTIVWLIVSMCLLGMRIRICKCLCLFICVFCLCLIPVIGGGLICLSSLFEEKLRDVTVVFCINLITSFVYSYYFGYAHNHFNND